MQIIIIIVIIIKFYAAIANSNTSREKGQAKCPSVSVKVEIKNYIELLLFLINSLIVSTAVSKIVVNYVIAKPLLKLCACLVMNLLTQVFPKFAFKLLLHG